jgi:hypothetical protein
MTAIVTILIRGSVELPLDAISRAEVEFDPDSLEYELLGVLDHKGLECLLMAYMSRNGYTTVNPALGEYISSVYLDDRLLGEPSSDRVQEWNARVQDRINTATRDLNFTTSVP